MIVLESRGQIHQEAPVMDAATHLGLQVQATDSLAIEEAITELKAIDAKQYAKDWHTKFLCDRLHSAIAAYRAGMTERGPLFEHPSWEVIRDALRILIVDAKSESENYRHELATRDKDNDKRMSAKMRAGSW